MNDITKLSNLQTSNARFMDFATTITSGIGASKPTI
jgi:hypothetical protein